MRDMTVKPKFQMPHPAIVCGGDQLLSVIAELEAGTYPFPPEDAIWRGDLDRPLAVRLARATGADDAQICALVPHVRVCWSNAISVNGREYQCFASRDEALAAYADGRRPWNNTRVEMYWHEAHDRITERQAMFDAHFGTIHVWGLDCRRCAEMSAHRAASEAEVIAARDAAGDRHLHAVTS